MFPGLLQSQKNAIFRSIEGMGFDPKEFEFKRGGVSGTMADYRGYTFLVQIERGHRVCNYIPGQETTNETHGIDNWDDFKSCFDDWLTNVHREISEPDLWKQLYKQAEMELIPPDPNVSNSPFTPAEVQQITEGLKRVRLFLEEKAAKDTTDKLLIESRLDYIIQALPKQNRLDWKNLAMGALFSLFISLGTNPDIAKGAWAIFQGALNALPKLLH